ncbi:MAG: glycosyltransferase family 39 protein [Chloroflexi bacterium]|nr:glycosyltransferase family 39 protein [Chloroflexota bacterium]
MLRQPPNKPLERFSALRLWMPGLIIAIGALALRLWYVLFRPQVQPVWDAALYDATAMRIAAIIRGSSITRETLVELDAVWLKGPIHPLVLGLVYALFGHSYTIVRLLQALLDAGTCLVLYALGCRLYGRRGAVFGASLAAIYTPFVLVTGTIIQEPLTFFLLAVAVYLLVRASESTQVWDFLWAGVALGLVVLSRVALQFLFIVFLPVVVLVLWRKVTAFWRHVLAFSLGLVILLGPWMFLTQAVQGRVSLSGGYGYGLVFYRGLYLPDEWWIADVIPQSTQLKQVMAVRGHVEPTDADYWSAYFLTVQQNPLHALSVMVGRLYYYWQYPFNLFAQHVVMPRGVDIAIHQFVVIMGVLGAFLGLGARREPLFLISVVVYVLVTLMAFPLEIRIAMPAMPFLCVLAGGAVDFVVACLGDLWRGDVDCRRRFLDGLVVAVIAFGLFSFLPVPILLRIAPGLGPVVARGLTILLTVFLAATLARLGYLVLWTRLPRRRALFIAGFGTCVFLTLWLLHARVDGTWRRWSVRLVDSEVRLRQQIALPEELGPVKWAAVFVDMNSGPGRNYGLGLWLNGKVLAYWPNGLLIEQSGPLGEDLQYRILLEQQRRLLEEVPQWVVIPVEPTRLKRLRSVVLELGLGPAGNPRTDYVEVYGDYRLWEPVFNGPSFNALGVTERTSFYRYVIDGEYRLWEAVPFATGWPRSEYVVSSGSFVDDLSPVAGLQTGQYRMFIVAMGEDDVIRVY